MDSKKMTAYMKTHNPNYKSRTAYSKCMTRISHCKYVRTRWSIKRPIMWVNRSMKECKKWWKLQRFVGKKIKLGHFKRFSTNGYRTTADNFLCYFDVKKTKYRIPVDEMNLYDGITILYEAQLARDTVGSVSLCDDVLSVVRQFLVK